MRAVREPVTDFLDRVRAAKDDDNAALLLALGELGADTGTVHRLGADGMLHLEAWAGHIPEALLPIIQTIPVGKGIAGLAVERNEPVDLCNLQVDTSGVARPKARDTGVKGSLCVPIQRDGKPIGALGVATVAEREFTAAETAKLQAVGRILGED